jgi:hypothetical protein
MAIFNTDLQNRGPNQFAMLYSTQAFCTSFLKGIKHENFGSEFLTPPSQPIWKDLLIGRNNLFLKPLTSALVVIFVENCIKSMLNKNLEAHLEHGHNNIKRMLRMRFYSNRMFSMR